MFAAHESPVPPSRLSSRALTPPTTSPASEKCNTPPLLDQCHRPSLRGRWRSGGVWLEVEASDPRFLFLSLKQN
ncbi:hypothetical protein E2C01_075701 [Portunus trituberculatus]|uniref:Uncharacterized protein n=1 Tax=Portunus trituberculatus TaxID=210409 RepID=A0A5B7I997_PORTR|nr:hypothetical protein [Portunus trituberculatus]